MSEAQKICQKSNPVSVRFCNKHFPCILHYISTIVCDTGSVHAKEKLQMYFYFQCYFFSSLLDLILSQTDLYLPLLLHVCNSISLCSGMS